MFSLGKNAISGIPFREPGRRTPAKGVHVSLGGPNWVFLTVCTGKRGRWLAQTSVQHALHDIWQHTATAWLVSDYLLMPDHLHLFCAPHDLKFTIERWIGFWKDRFAKTREPEWGERTRPRVRLDAPRVQHFARETAGDVRNFSVRPMFSAGARKTARGARALPIQFRFPG